MRLELRGHHVDITPALRRLVSAKVGKIEQLLNDGAVSVKAILTVEKHRHRANITLHARGERFLHGEAETDKWETSVSGAVVQQLLDFPDLRTDQSPEGGGDVDVMAS